MDIGKNDSKIYSARQNTGSDCVGKLLVKDSDGLRLYATVVDDALPPVAVGVRNVDVKISNVDGIVFEAEYLGPGTSGLAEILVTGAVTVGADLYFYQGSVSTTSTNGWRIGQALEAKTNDNVLVNTCNPEAV